MDCSWQRDQENKWQSSNNAVVENDTKNQKPKSNIRPDFSDAHHFLIVMGFSLYMISVSFVQFAFFRWKMKADCTKAKCSHNMEQSRSSILLISGPEGKLSLSLLPQDETGIISFLILASKSSISRQCRDSRELPG